MAHHKDFILVKRVHLVIFAMYLHKSHFRFYLLFLKLRTEPISPRFGDLCH